MSDEPVLTYYADQELVEETPKQTIVSYSEIYKFQTCNRQYYYKHILGRTPIKMPEAPDTGTKGHKLLQYFYTLLAQGHTKEEAWKLTTAQAAKELLEHGSSDKNLVRAWTLVDNYIRDNEFPHTAILIENRFLIPAWKLTDDPEVAHVYIGFTPDVVFERKGGFRDVEDYKFIQRAWSKRKINRLPQIKLYQIFLETMGFKISRSVLRFFNVTTAQISAQPYTLKGNERETLIHDFMCGVKDVIRYREGSAEHIVQAPRTMNYTACQFCDYEFVCGLEAEGKDASKSLQNLYTDNKYDYAK